MKFPSASVVIFTAGFAVVALCKRPPEVASAPVTRSAGAGARSAVASPAESREALVAAVRAALRVGDLEGARRLLAEAARRDPRMFFAALKQLPRLEGLDEVIREAAAKLAWNEPAITGILNDISAVEWRKVAWAAYIGARMGERPDDEIWGVLQKADGSGWFAGSEVLMKDAAEKRPVAFMAVLNRFGGTSIREQYCYALMKSHPELAGELFRSIPDGSSGANYDRAYFLQAQVMSLPTARNLMAAISEAGPSALTQAQCLANWTYEVASVEERRQIRQAMASQPDALRQQMVTGALSAEAPAAPFAEFNELLKLSDPGLQQRKALEGWLEKQPDLDPADREWVAGLPTEKLRGKANELLDQRAVQEKSR